MNHLFLWMNGADLRLFHMPVQALLPLVALLPSEENPHLTPRQEKKAQLQRQQPIKVLP